MPILLLSVVLLCVPSTLLIFIWRLSDMELFFPELCPLRILSQGYTMVRVAVRRGGRKRPNAKGIVYGKHPRPTVLCRCMILKIQLALDLWDCLFMSLSNRLRSVVPGVDLCTPPP